MNKLLSHPLIRAIPWRSLAIPLIVFLILTMMILPLPPMSLPNWRSQTWRSPSSVPA